MTTRSALLLAAIAALTLPQAACLDIKPFDADAWPKSLDAGGADADADATPDPGPETTPDVEIDQVEDPGSETVVDAEVDQVDDQDDGAPGDADSEAGCTSDADCETGDPCLSGACVDGGCSTTDNDGASCDDGDPCTHTDTCGGGSCAGTAYDCPVEAECLEAACNGDGTCADPAPKPGSCFATGIGCLSEGETPIPTYPCLACGPDGLFVPSGTGEQCESLNSCETGTGTCSGGACIGPSELPDGTPCAVPPGVPDCIEPDGTCNSGTCEFVAKPGFCYFFGECFAVGSKNSDGCQSCLSGGVLEPVVDGAGCDDENPCTVSDTCAGGFCGGTQKACDDGDACTTDTCNPLTGSCEASTKEEGSWCEPGGLCSNPGQCESQVCVAGPPHGYLGFPIHGRLPLVGEDKVLATASTSGTVWALIGHYGPDVTVGQETYQQPGGAGVFLVGTSADSGPDVIKHWPLPTSSLDSPSWVLHADFNEFIVAGQAPAGTLLGDAGAGPVVVQTYQFIARYDGAGNLTAATFPDELDGGNVLRWVSILSSNTSGAQLGILELFAPIELQGSSGAVPLGAAAGGGTRVIASVRLDDLLQASNGATLLVSDGLTQLSAQASSSGAVVVATFNTPVSVEASSEATKPVLVPSGTDVLALSVFSSGLMAWVHHWTSAKNVESPRVAVSSSGKLAITSSLGMRVLLSSGTEEWTIATGAARLPGFFGDQPLCILGASPFNGELSYETSEGDSVILVPDGVPAEWSNYAVTFSSEGDPLPLVLTPFLVDITNGDWALAPHTAGVWGGTFGIALVATDLELSSPNVPTPIDLSGADSDAVLFSLSPAGNCSDTTP